MNTTLIGNITSIVFALLLYSYVEFNTAEDDPFCVVIEGICFRCSSDRINGTMVEEHCYNESRYPASINSTTQLTAIKDQCLHKYSYLNNWVNTNRMNGSFYWNADDSPVHETFWAPRLPVAIGDCVFYDKFTKKLKNVLCHHNYTYICAYSTEIRIEETTEAPRVEIDKGRENLAEGNSSADGNDKGSACKNCRGHNCQGCKDGCVDGFYDDECNTECSSKCQPRVCEKDNGSCVSLSTGSGANQHISNCTKHCASVNTCDTSNAPCSKGCETGYHGPNCDKVCSTICTNHKCDQFNGRCTEGCPPGQNKTECQTSKESSVSKDSESSMVTFVWIAVPVVSVLTSAAIIGLVIMRRKKAKKVVAGEGGDEGQE